MKIPELGYMLAVGIGIIALGLLTLPFINSVDGLVNATFGLLVGGGVSTLMFAVLIIISERDDDY